MATVKFQDSWDKLWQFFQIFFLLFDTCHKKFPKLPLLLDTWYLLRQTQLLSTNLGMLKEKKNQVRIRLSCIDCICWSCYYKLQLLILLGWGGYILMSSAFAFSLNISLIGGGSLVAIYMEQKLLVHASYNQLFHLIIKEAFISLITAIEMTTGPLVYLNPLPAFAGWMG